MTIPNSQPGEALERLTTAIRGLDAARGVSLLHSSVQEVLGSRSTLEYPKVEREELGRVLDAAEPERSESVLRRLWSEKRAREAGTLSAWRSRMCGVLAALRRLDDRQVATIVALGTSGKVLAAIGSAVNRAAETARKAGRTLDGQPYVGLAVMQAIEAAVQPPPKAKREGLARVRSILEQVGRLAPAAEKAAGEEGVPCFGGFAAEVERVAGAALAAAEAAMNAPPPPADPDPADPDPGDADPADPDPGDADPADPDPADPDPGDADPGDADPADPDPGDADPGDADPAPPAQTKPKRRISG